MSLAFHPGLISGGLLFIGVHWWFQDRFASSLTGTVALADGCGPESQRPERYGGACVQRPLRWLVFACCCGLKSARRATVRGCADQIDLFFLVDTLSKSVHNATNLERNSSGGAIVVRRSAAGIVSSFFQSIRSPGLMIAAVNYRSRSGSSTACLPFPTTLTAALAFLLSGFRSRVSALSLISASRPAGAQSQRVSFLTRRSAMAKTVQPSILNSQLSCVSNTAPSLRLRDISES